MAVSVHTPFERIIIVDDGSTDATVARAHAFADKLPLQVVSHEKNAGVGQAFRTGLAQALSLAQDHDLVMTLEADGTSQLGILPEMLRKIEIGADLVLASCYAKGGKISGTTPFRILTSKVANILLRLFSGKKFATYSSFYRLYRVAPLNRAVNHYGSSLITEAGFTCMAELLLKLANITEAIVEVPMHLDLTVRKGKSKMKIANTTLAYLRMFTELRKRDSQQ